MGTEGARPAALSWADLVCRSARVNTAGSLAEDVAMGGERRQQGDAVGMISSKVCRCVCGRGQSGWGCVRTGYRQGEGPAFLFNCQVEGNAATCLLKGQVDMMSLMFCQHF